MQPTLEQTSICDLASSTTKNLMINALAGTGKTTTLEMLEAVLPTKPVLYLVFNRKNVDEAQAKMSSTTMVTNFNSLGSKIWAKACVMPRLALNRKKIPDLLRELILAQPRAAQRRMWSAFWNVVEGVNMARAIGYIPAQHQRVGHALATQADLCAAVDEDLDQYTLSLIDDVLLLSIARAYAGYVDFNDQIYMPTLFGGNFPKFPVVFVDEYQDLNPVNHRMIQRLVTARIIGVGDPNQNIYAFRGAKAQGMADAVSFFSMTQCDLSVSFRCPEAIVRNVHWLVPHYRWSKPGGLVVDLDKLRANDIPDNATIICRNNAPLFSLAMKLLRSGRSVQVSGSDVGPKVLGQLKRLGRPESTQSQLLEAIDAWEQDKLTHGSKSASDLAECMRIFAGYGDNLSQAIAYADHLFSQQGHIRFTTGHKAKGLEWDCVYHLDPWLLSGDQQDRNLRYVISTRAAERLYTINSANVEF